MDDVYIVVDVHFQGIFAKYPIRYTDGVTQRLVDIDFTGMDKDKCYAFMARLSAEMREKLYYCQLDIDFPKRGDEDEVEVKDEDEDDNRRPHFIKEDKGTQSDMGANPCVVEPVDEDMDDNKDVDPDLPNIFNEHLHWKGQVPVLGMRF
ncbi:unnamed protein product [Lactuca virosa]|uniref:FACT complex subunit n=1 Tax=Lactuca virosa TaxID=75947 RepID=A0AAU9M9X8_9ASTR|nr:unnamed protein product [Lactuca virosa]